MMKKIFTAAVVGMGFGLVGASIGLEGEKEFCFVLGCSIVYVFSGINE